MVLTPKTNRRGTRHAPESRKGGTTGIFTTPVQGQTAEYGDTGTTRSPQQKRGATHVTPLQATGNPGQVSGYLISVKMLNIGR